MKRDVPQFSGTTTPSEYLQRLFGLDGLTATVIGATGVLGGAIAETLARAGAHCVVVGQNEERGNACVERICQGGGSAEFVAASVTERGDLESIVRHLDDAGRRTDILVNGAGTNSATPFLEIEEDEWDRILDINLRGVRLACQVFGEHMIANETPGRIINIASVSAPTPLSRVFTYSISKAGVLSLTQNLAREWAPKGIRVNALSPGFFPAEQNRKILSPDRVESILRHTPVADFGVPEELSAAVLLLASPMASSYLTGANLIVDGGFSAMTI